MNNIVAARQRRLPGGRVSGPAAVSISNDPQDNQPQIHLFVFHTKKTANVIWEATNPIPATSMMVSVPTRFVSRVLVAPVF
ncbi:hypothetical protein [Marinithermofilum abyssi]|uniref:hypothetical protein n=1 Tax=Marinithermofilum abyssi TaxID=1571185 RepID=UPI00166BBBB9|nr:hypothetical protein [Marinithermofilum abyssi]